MISICLSAIAASALAAISPPAYSSSDESASYGMTNACERPEMLSTDEREVCRRFRDMIDATRRLDGAALTSHYWEDGFSAIIGGVIRRDFQAWRAELIAAFEMIARVEDLDFPEVAIQTIDPETILLLNTYTETLHMKDGTIVPVEGAGTQLWRRRDGEWRLSHVTG